MGRGEGTSDAGAPRITFANHKHNLSRSVILFALYFLFRFCPIGISVGEEVLNEGGLEARHVFTDKANGVVTENYDKLKAKMGLN